MTPVKIRARIKKTVNEVPAERLAALAEYVSYLARPPILERIEAAEKEVAAGKGVNWRKVHRDV